VDAGSQVAYRDAAALPAGWAVTSSGRMSIATEPENMPGQFPFRALELVTLDDALTRATRQSKARFAVYIGDLGADPAANARHLLAGVPTPNNAVLLAVSPDQRAIEVAYGADLHGRGIDSAAPLGVSAAASAFRQGNLMDGLVSAVRVMSAAIARPNA